MELVKLPTTVLPPHQDDVDLALRTVRDVCAAAGVSVEITRIDDAQPDVTARLGDDDERRHDHSASPQLVKLAGELENQLAELPRVELWSDSSVYDNSWLSTVMVAFNVMVCAAPFDRWGRPTYLRTDAFVAILTDLVKRVLPTAGPLCLAWEIRMSDGQVFVPCVHGSCIEIDTLRQWRREDADQDAIARRELHDRHGIPDGD